MQSALSWLDAPESFDNLLGLPRPFVIGDKVWNVGQSLSTGQRTVRRDRRALHHPTALCESEQPSWLVMPETGLYTDHQETSKHCSICQSVSSSATWPPVATQDSTRPENPAPAKPRILDQPSACCERESSVRPMRHPWIQLRESDSGIARCVLPASPAYAPRGH